MTSSAAPHESTCKRCGGFMVNDFYKNLLFCIGETEFAAQRCVQCGEIVDPVILRNRGIKPEPVTAQPAGKMVRNNRAPNGRGRFALQTHGTGFLCARGLANQTQQKQTMAMVIRRDHILAEIGGRFPLPVLVALRLSAASPTEVDRSLFTPRRDLSSR